MNLPKVTTIHPKIAAILGMMDANGAKIGVNMGLFGTIPGWMGGYMGTNEVCPALGRRSSRPLSPRLRLGRALGLMVVVFGLSLLAPSVAEAQLIEWQQRSVSGPSPRSGHAIAYDTARSLSMCFGGYSAGAYDDGTWEWNGTAWNQRMVSGPSPRAYHAMAYDTAREVTVLFGGSSTVSKNGETWEWNGTTWTQRAVSGPSSRADHAMAYDSVRGVTVLFGGYTENGANGETWEWNGTTWAQRAIGGPSPRFYHAMAYDSVRGVTVLFGGNFGDNLIFSNETWEWNGSEWTQRAVSGPSGRFFHAMAYDSARGVTVLFGGSTASGRSGETWEWNGSVWAQRAVIGPTPRFGPAVAYDSLHGMTILFGGVVNSGPNGQTWELVTCNNPVSVASQPSSEALLPGGVASFSVSVNGPATAFQWRHNSVDLSDGPRISGATTPTLTISSVQASDEGNYDCVVTSACNAVTSNPAVLSCDPILLTHPPAQQLLVPGLALAVTVPDNAPYSYRWRQNGQNLFNIPGVFGGVTTRTLTILSNDPSLEGVYDVLVTNACGSATSTPADVRRCFADVNCDFALDGFDVEVQEKAVGGDITDYCQSDPDFNRDFALDGFDVEAVELVVGGGPCP